MDWGSLYRLDLAVAPNLFSEPLIRRFSPESTEKLSDHSAGLPGIFGPGKPACFFPAGFLSIHNDIGSGGELPQPRNVSF